MRIRKHVALAWALTVVVLMAAACFDRITNETIVTQDQSQRGSPPASPSAAPSVPGPVSGVSDVASMAIFVFGYDCATGVPQPHHFPGIIEPGCNGAAVTATPKQLDGKTDAVNHGNNITWSVAGDTNALRVEPDPANVLFNRKVNVTDPRRPGSAVTLTAVLLAPDGKRFEASKTVSIR